MAYKDPDKQKAYHKEWKKNHREQYRDYNRKWVAANKDKQLTSQLKHKYNLDLLSFKRMREEQNDCCKICRDPFSGTPNVDHCHMTGHIRGLLCATCNLMLGYAKDDSDILRLAAEYLEKEQ